ncbi:MAG: glycoside hydrolase family 88 protein [Ferruginibacter sp.]|nr:glycoside hydrolase family 88 protein [Ferruginibacter sp.]
MRKIALLTMTVLSATLAFSQAKPANDVTAPLHAMKVDYPTPYEPMAKEDIKKLLDRLYDYLDVATPAQMVNKLTQAIVTDPARIDSNTTLKQGDFRLNSYEWGVTYSGMLAAAEATGDAKYKNYVKDRFTFMGTWIAAAKKAKAAGVYRSNNYPFRQSVEPKALDDAGAICAAMIRATRAGVNSDLRPVIDHLVNFVAKEEYRFADGTLARMRPQKNTLWLDDLYMGIPALAEMGKLTGDRKYFDDAVNQLEQFTKRMFNKEKGLYMHGWVESMETHPEFRWGRANGWALLATVDLLDVLPNEHPRRAFVLEQLKAHVKGIAAYQAGTGFWHQLLDREDSYLETSATAIYAYAIAHACNKGWINAVTYAPMANLAWNAVATKINAKGQVEGTCVGTGMAFDPAFYYHRPVNVFAAHGYGPVLLAAAEMYRLVGKGKFKMNDSSVQYYE